MGETCLYYSNDLSMDYLDTRDWGQRSCVEEHPQLKAKANRINEKMRIASKTPVVVTRTASKEGAMLSLVKTKKDTGSTLELMVTGGDGRSSACSSSKYGSEHGNSDTFSVIASTSKNSLKSESSKKSKWSYLKMISVKRFKHKSIRDKPAREESKRFYKRGKKTKKLTVEDISTCHNDRQDEVVHRSNGIANHNAVVRSSTKDKHRRSFLFQISTNL